MSVAMPEKKIAVLALKPMSIGPNTVAPNMATTCWIAAKMFGMGGSDSSG